MSRLSKICLTIAGFSLLFVAVPRLFLQEWTHILFVPLCLFLASVTIAIVKDRRIFFEFFTMKTTKHGMNMGAVIVLTLVMIATINYLGFRFLERFKYDWTHDKLNSISEQTLQVLKSLDSDLEVKFFYGRAVQDIERAKEQFRSTIRLYEDKSKFVKTEFISSVERPDVAEEFKVDSGDTVVFLRYKGAKQRVEKIDEEGITNVILKLQKPNVKTVYMTIGHGERDVASKEPTGLTDFKQALEDNQYAVKTLKLFEEGKVPEDAAVVFVIGPTQVFLENELQALREYAKNGGKLFIAMDPGQKHNLAHLTKTFGVEFSNTYIVDPAGVMNTNALGAALGVEYSKNSELTKGFNSQMITLFYLASTVKKAPDASPLIRVDETVKTSPKSLLTAEVPKRGAKVIAGSAGAQPVMVTAQGKLDDKSKEFSAVIAADSDFLTNQFLFQLLNRDLALNSVAYLVQDKDMITIRPKLPAGTTLMMTQYQKLGLVLGYLIAPLILFLVGGGVWLRRKYA